jgi:hypothetical protein
MNPTDRDWLRRGLAALGSLKLTVALLGTATFLVFAGTVAQVNRGLWTAVDQYFRCWVAWIEFRALFFFLPQNTDVGGGFPFPGGKLIGLLLVANLLVSHARRIRLQARGNRLLLGAATLAVGSALTWLAISHVFDADSAEQKVAPFWRVTVQLLQGGGVAAVLFFGCKLLFGRKAGIVLLHAGIVLMMATELIVTYFAEEGMMRIDEGQSADYVEDTRKVELAVIDPSPRDHDEVVAVHEDGLRSGASIRDPRLPFEVEVRRFMKNAGIRQATGRDTNLATAGTGLQYVAVERQEESGASAASRVDQSAAYVTLKADGATLGTYLVALLFTANDLPQRVTAGGKTYDLYLRFSRRYKPYEVHLKDFRFERYPGTNTPKDFSSYVTLVDRERGVERDVRIWMNNPLRYRGDTLYQADWDKETEAGTVLQVVTNTGWMVPYVACMIVATGLLGQFGLHLLEFLRKRRAAA